jgi:hypothetical protein
MFLHSPDRWTKVSVSRKSYQSGVVPISGRLLSGHDKTVQMALQKQRQLSAGLQSIDFVSGAGSVRVPQNMISWNEFTTIDFGMITDLSGLLKAITHTIRVMLRLLFVIRTRLFIVVLMHYQIRINCMSVH